MATVTCTPIIPGYQICAQLYVGAKTHVYQAIRQSDHLPVVIKLLASEYPSFHELLEFRNQYTISKNLQIPGIVQPLSLLTHHNSYILVMPDTGKISLQEYVNSTHISLVEFLSIAIQLTSILDAIHQNRVIHKDIKPANILIHPHTKQVQLIDFSIASLLPKETSEIKNPNVLEGTLAYISPEQTGRMNRGIDYRSDYYSLGVTLYELLTGELPFNSDDPMELVHCHLAKMPQVIESSKPIPQVVAEIVLKLMAKNAEDRYQSALGLKHDLELCLTQLKDTGEIRHFKIAQRDVCDRFLIPEKLYGREAEVSTLLQAFERVASGTSEMMLVAGFSGIGKTAVVNEVHKPITRQQGYFIKGKFDQFNRNIPFSAFVQVFRDLMGQLLAESDSQLRIWKQQVLAALGDNAQVITKVIPELELIIGTQPTAPELSGLAAQNRFNLLFEKFIQVFTTKEHPLVIFLDDLQWADAASLKLIELLISESSTGYLLLIGAYRDNEVFAAHPLMLTLDAIAKAKATVNTITLKPLSTSSLNQLIADTLHCAGNLAQPLTELVYQKTQGNPFFATQFLKALHQEKLINFDLQTGHWQCDISQLKSTALTDDVVELMAQQLKKLPLATQNVLKLAACVGNQFDLSTLTIVSEQSEAATASDLWKALQEGLILPISQIYKFFQLENLEQSEIAQNANPSYRFLHDRVQQAAYSLIPDDQKQAVHYNIGQLLLKQISLSAREEQIFALVNQLNYGTSLITAQSQRNELAQMNLCAGRKARVATAYQAAYEYATVGLGLLATDTWQHQYEMTLALHELAAETAALSGDFEQMEYWINAVIQHTKTPLDQVQSYQIKIQALNSRNDFIAAIATGKSVLQTLGVSLPDQPTSEDVQQARQQIQDLIGDRAIADLIHLPKLVAPEQLAIMQIAASIIPACYVTASPLYPLVVALQVQHSIQYGNSLFSPWSYANYAFQIKLIWGDIREAEQFGYLAYQLGLEPEFKYSRAATFVVFAGYIYHCTAPLRETIPILQLGYQAGVETGSLEFVLYTVQALTLNAFWSGQDLSEVEYQIRSYHQQLQELKQVTTAKHYLIYWETALILLGKSEDEVTLRQASYEATLIAEVQVSQDVFRLCIFYLHRFILNFWLGEYGQAQQDAAQTRQYLAGCVGTIIEPVFYFYDALIMLATLPQGSEVTETQWQRIEENQTALNNWAQYAPMNHQHKVDLIAAEKYRVLGQKAEAIEQYNQAIAGAKTNGYLQEEALIHELAAKFYLNWGQEKLAAIYLQDAYYCYARWGAKAKTEELENTYPNLLQPILQPTAQSLIPLETLASIASPKVSIHSSSKTIRSASTLNTALDFATIIKVSQSLSGVIQLDELLHQLTQIILQNSGGDHCVLILPDTQGEWQVRAIATPEHTELCSQPLEGNLNLPVKLIQYVKHTQEVLVIDDIQTDLPVIDEYLQEKQPKSLLCLPILNQGHLIGILYLKNRSASGVFTSDRILILNFLCTQAAISLENARLYQDSQIALQELQQSQQLLRSIIDNIPQVVFWKDRNSNYLGCNQKFAIMAGLPSPEAIVGKNDYDLPWSKAESDSYREYDRRIMESKQPQLHIIETQQQTDGKTIWIDTSKIPLCDEAGEVYGILGSYEDISDRKQTEVAIQQKSQELEKALQELQQAQLQMVQNEKMSALGNLVAGVAHEMNNPLGFISASLQQAKPTLTDIIEHLALYQQALPNTPDEILDHAEKIDIDYSLEDLPKVLDAMVLACDRLQNISTSLRTFSRADKDYKVTFNINEGIDSTILILKHRLKANEQRPAINVVTEYANCSPIACFPGQLNQVFMNILANAIDALDESGMGRSYEELKLNPHQIIVKTAIENHSLKISIADNGKGMSEEVKLHIFDHLFTTKGVGKGTGLGLAIARQIVEEKHGGKIAVNSVLGQGTEFVISLPITDNAINNN
ncbi:AAA family ATPase [Nostoc sp. FACHB-87]|uniref:trifunctional serine/threonine-protein kinase/ATP-binding protein/sensor histidine kinase n=1 Tax=Nostocaceae TaxID=1162 RepID=UPI0016846CEC|nr:MULTISPECIES: AAA family ATPase [Nostocaceae]MBD2453247.1 AAA family ATPase [Nostoc sp. FACHB-87]MBD2474973.1 AAA family ATPase [Anabaena sp. FACHB-83]